MDQASRIIAKWSGAPGVISPERLACGAWKKAVGKYLADHTRAVKLVRDRLIVEVEDETWALQLRSLRMQIVRNLEKSIGPQIVAHVDFRIMPPRREPQREALIALRPPEEGSDITDPGLRRIYRNARRRETA